MADKFCALVMRGHKRATVSLLREYAATGESLPRVGGFAVMMDGRDQPRCILQTTEVRIGPLCSVDDQFAFDEGEGDRRRAYWLAEHRAFFGRMAAAQRFALHDAIETVFERFAVLWPLEHA